MHNHLLRFLLLMMAGWMNRRQQDVIAYLQEENRVLRESTKNSAANVCGSQTINVDGWRPRPRASAADGCWRSPTSLSPTHYCGGISPVGLHRAVIAVGRVLDLYDLASALSPVSSGWLRPESYRTQSSNS
jgi:hypothetical protein